MQYLLSRGARAVGLAGLIGALLGVVAAHPASAATTTQIPATPASTDPATCASPSMSQTFLSVKDRNWYTLAPGQSTAGFTGSGWTLANGAEIVTTQLQDGQSGSVLNLPSGAVAVSAPICVTSDYPTARTLVRNVVGGDGVQFYVSYQGTRTWEHLQEHRAAARPAEELDHLGSVNQIPVRNLIPRDGETLEDDLGVGRQLRAASPRSSRRH